MSHSHTRTCELITIASRSVFVSVHCVYAERSTPGIALGGGTERGGGQVPGPADAHAGAVRVEVVEVEDGRPPVLLTVEPLRRPLVVVEPGDPLLRSGGGGALPWVMGRPGRIEGGYVCGCAVRGPATIPVVPFVSQMGGGAGEDLPGIGTLGFPSGVFLVSLRLP